MKKGWARLLCVCLALTALAGCSGKTKEMQKVDVYKRQKLVLVQPSAAARAFISA